MWFDFLKRLRNNSSSSRFCLDLNTHCRYNTSIFWSGYILVPHQSITALHIQPKCKLPTPKCGLTWQRQQTEDTGKLTTSYSSRKIAAVTGDWKDRPPAEAPWFHGHRHGVQPLTVSTPFCHTASLCGKLHVLCGFAFALMGLCLTSTSNHRFQISEKKKLVKVLL